MVKTLNEINISDNATLFDHYLDVWVLMDKTKYMISRARELELHQFGITPEQASVMRALQNNTDGLAIVDLPKIILREPHSIYCLIGRMEKKGLVKKIKFSNNENTRVVLTRKGKQLYNKSLDRTSLRMILSVLSREELDSLERLLSKLKERSSTLLGIEYRPPFLK